MADESSYTLSVTNGRGITGITWSTSGTPGNGLLHTGTIAYNDGTTSQVQFQDGVKGNTGAQTYVWFKWAQNYPTQDSDMQNSVGPYIGICATTSATAPTSYTAYTWYDYKGKKGDTGASVNSITLTSTSGLIDTYTITLTDGNTSTFNVTNAKSIVSVTMISGSHAAGTTDVYQILFNDGDTANFSVYNGANGLGSVSTVSGIQADGNGDVPQVISGNGAPTTATAGQENQLYYDMNSSVLYYCAGESGGTYIWMGSGVTVDSSLSGSSTNPVQNAVITNRIGTGTLPNSNTNLTAAINYVDGRIPTAATQTPLADTTGGAVGTGTNWARNDHQHPLNVATSGVPADLGTAANGSSANYARQDHVHNMPSAAQVGAVAPSDLVDLIYPVGAIYMSTNSTDPGVFLGGEWTRIQDTFLLAAGSTYTAGDTGGAATHAHTTGGHTLTTSEIPSHAHNAASDSTVRFATTTSASGGTISRVTAASGSGVANILQCANGITRYGTTANTGGGGSHSHGNTGSSSNMPPYLAVYVWERTA